MSTHFVAGYRGVAHPGGRPAAATCRGEEVKLSPGGLKKKKFSGPVQVVQGFPRRGVFGTASGGDATTAQLRWRTRRWRVGGPARFKVGGSVRN